MSLVFPSLRATSSTAASTFFWAAFASSEAPSPASVLAAMRVPAQVRKSLAVKGGPTTSLT